MSLARVKELAKAGADGSIRPDELRELWALLPAVVEAAEVPSIRDAAVEALAYYTAAPLRPLTPKNRLLHMYIAGARRAARGPGTP